MKKSVLAQKAVDEQEIYGRWRAEGLVEGSTRKIIARCLDCSVCYEVDLYSLRRKDRGNERCQACSNRKISEGNRHPPKTALVKNQYHEYRKAATKRGIQWSLDFDKFSILLSKNCSYCGEAPSRRIESAWDYVLVNGIDRVDNDDYYHDGNVVTCCKDCNYAKRAMPREKFIALCRRVVEYDNRVNGSPGGRL